MAHADRWPREFRRMVVLGESTVEGGGWIADPSERWTDILAGLINSVQAAPVDYINKGIGANSISPKSPGYEASAKPSAIERYRADVIEQNPDLFLLCYGLNDMRAAMPVEKFIGEMRTIINDVRDACEPLIVLTTIYYMTAWKAFAPFDKGSFELTQAYNDAIKKLAEEEGCLVADIWRAESGHERAEPGADWVMNPCGIHANKVGNLLIAHEVFRALAVNCSGLSAATHKRDSTTKWARETTEMREEGDPFDPWWQKG